MEIPQGLEHAWGARFVFHREEEAYTSCDAIHDHTHHVMLSMIIVGPDCHSTYVQSLVINNVFSLWQEFRTLPSFVKIILTSRPTTPSGLQLVSIFRYVDSFSIFVCAGMPSITTNEIRNHSGSRPRNCAILIPPGIGPRIPSSLRRPTIWMT